MAKIAEQPVGDASAEAAAAAPPPAEEHKLSPKNKITRGVDPSLKTTWVPFDQTPESRDRLVKVASQRKVSLAALLALVLKHGVETFKEQFDADAAAWDANPESQKKSKGSKPAKPIADMTAEELVAFEKKQGTVLERAQKAAQKAAQMLEEAKARMAQPTG